MFPVVLGCPGFLVGLEHLEFLVFPVVLGCPDCPASPELPAFLACPASPVCPEHPGCPEGLEFLACPERLHLSDPENLGFLEVLEGPERLVFLVILAGPVVQNHQLHLGGLASPELPELLVPLVPLGFQ